MEEGALPERSDSLPVAIVTEEDEFMDATILNQTSAIREQQMRDASSVVGNCVTAKAALDGAWVGASHHN